MESTPESLLRKTGALLDGHFQLSSGLHSPMYVEKFRLLEQPTYTEQLCHLIANHFREYNVDVVAGPTTGGIIISYEIANQLGVRGIFAESNQDGRQFDRGFQITQGERVLIVDDVLTTGKSIKDVVSAVRDIGGNPIGIGVLVNRSKNELQIDLPLFSCLDIELPTYNPEECHLCKNNISLTQT